MKDGFFCGLYFISQSYSLTKNLLLYPKGYHYILNILIDPFPSVTNINHVQTDNDRSGKTKIADTSWFQMISFEFSWICCNRGLTEENNQLGIISLIGNFKSPIGISNPQLIIFNPIRDWWFVLWLCVTRLIHPQSPIGYIIPNHRFVISNWW